MFFLLWSPAVIIAVAEKSLELALISVQAQDKA